MSKVAVILSGCGHEDGAEIREAVLSLLYLDQQGVEVSVFAPDVPQADTINHLTGNVESQSRNVLVEAARIARGKISPLSKLDVNAIDALVIPGGFGAAKNLSDFASKGADCTLLPDMETVIRACVKQKKPIAAICIAPAILAAALRGVVKPTVTIGDNKDVAGAIESMGGVHINCPTNECVADDRNLLVTCSAYMRDDPIGEVAKGIEKTIATLVKWAEQSRRAAA